MGKNLTFRGFEEIQTILDALPKKLGPPIILGVLRKGARPIVKRAKEMVSNADVTGNLTRSIGIINGRGQGKGESVYVGPRRGGGYYGYHGHLLEYGTGPRYNSKGAYRGHVAPFPFMRPAAEVGLPEAYVLIKDQLREIITGGFQNIF